MGLVRLVTLLAAALAAALFAWSCASSGATPRPFPGVPGAPDEPEAPANREAPGAARVDPALLVQTALSLRGTPYRNGGSNPKGFDCSGLVQYVFAQHGVTLPREVREQAQLGQEIRLAGIERGDLIFFRIASTDVSHVGVAIGGDEFIHAPSARGVVRVEKFSAPYWSRRIVGVRRIR
jgi:cell wall-associated NlpC family hydrolase